MRMSSQSDCFSSIATLYFFFFLASLFIHTLASPTPHYCRHDQRDALMEFKHEFPVYVSNSKPFYPYLRSWNISIDCCSWGGVTCDVDSGEVISLELYSIPLNNSLKPNSGLFKLQHLQNLTLHKCNLYGEIPSSLGNLSHLTYLFLSNNNLEGQLPDSIGNLTQLRYLFLDDNKFSGNIPVSFASLTKLSYLELSSNPFRGDIFHLLLNFTSLSILSIYYNQFSSTLPPDMSIFHKLERFGVGGNSFRGSFPTSLFMIPSLTSVDLRGNQFKGPIEFRNTSSSSKLKVLNLARNKFYGPIPKSISKFPSLERLYLTDNNFTGPFPKSVLKLANLSDLDLSHNNFIEPIPKSNLVQIKYLDLSNNRFEGEIPFWLGSVPNLMLSHNSFSSFEKSLEGSDVIMELDLSSNYFGGPLPHWICNIRWIMLLDLSNNSFNGSIPGCMRNILSRLTMLKMYNNNFSGILHPDIFVNATQLVSLDVSGNQLEGELPRSLINCRSLLLLNVGNNRVKDKFPSWLVSVVGLQVLILKSNKFYGLLYHPHVSIEFQNLKVIDISHNAFTGTLPPFYFSYWFEMTSLTLQAEQGDYLTDRMWSYAGNLLSMEIVNKGVDMEFEQIRKDFKAIDFSRNKLSGKIPDSIGLLKELRLLNLSGNAFTSNIPQSLANLTYLEALDLSQNQLSGRIPPELGSLSFLSTMNFSHNNLEGPIPRGTQFERLNCSAFMDNPSLNGLEDICRETHVPDPTPQEYEDLSEPEEQVISWIAAAIAYGPGVFCGLVIGHIFASHKHEWLMEKFGLNKWRAPITFRSTH